MIRTNCLASIILLMLLTSCSNNSPQNTSSQKTTGKFSEVEKYYYEGIVYTIKEDFDGNIINDKDYSTIENILEHPTSGFIKSRDGSITYLYTNDQQADEVFKIVRNEGNAVKTLNKTKASISWFRYYQKSDQGGYYKDDSESNRSTLSNVPFPGGGSWNDQISCIIINSDGGQCQMRFYEHSNYGGKSFGITTWLDGWSYTSGIHNMPDKCMTRILGACIKDWNDKVSSFKQMY